MLHVFLHKYGRTRSRRRRSGNFGSHTFTDETLSQNDAFEPNCAHKCQLRRPYSSSGGCTLPNQARFPNDFAYTGLNCGSLDDLFVKIPRLMSKAVPMVSQSYQSCSLHPGRSGSHHLLDCVDQTRKILASRLEESSRDPSCRRVMRFSFVPSA